MDRIEKLCADRGMRMTEQRRVIARVLSSAEDHPDVEELYRRASSIDPHISIATVYRTVRLFEEAGVVEKHDFGDGRSRYEEAGDDHHDHLIDTRTGEVIEFFDAEIERLKSEIAKRLGFELIGHKLELYGVPIEGAEPSSREGLIFTRHAARVNPADVQRRIDAVARYGMALPAALPHGRPGGTCGGSIRSLTSTSPRRPRR